MVVAGVVSLLLFRLAHGILWNTLIYTNLDLSANITSHKFRVPLLCLEIMATLGEGLYLLLFLAFFLSGLFGRGDRVEPKIRIYRKTRFYFEFPAKQNLTRFTFKESYWFSRLVLRASSNTLFLSGEFTKMFIVITPGRKMVTSTTVQ